MFGHGDRHFVTFLELKIGLAIVTDKTAASGLARKLFYRKNYLDCDLRIWRYTNRSERETVRRYGSDQNWIDAILHDWSASRKRICRRTSGRRYENSIPCSLRDFLLVDENLQNDPLWLLSGNTHFIYAGLAELVDDFALRAALDLDRLDAHDFRWGERKLNFLSGLPVVVIGNHVDDILDLILLKSAHKPKGASLEGNDGRSFFRKLFGRVQNCTIATNSYYEVDFVVGKVLLGKQGIVDFVPSVEGFLLDFLQSALVQEVEINWDRVGEQLDYALD